jgi:hypothetical protein
LTNENWVLKVVKVFVFLFWEGVYGALNEGLVSSPNTRDKYAYGSIFYHRFSGNDASSKSPIDNAHLQGFAKHQ